MSRYINIFVMAGLAFSLLLAIPVDAEVTADPHGVAVTAAGDPVGETIVLSNDADEPVEYGIFLRELILDEDQALIRQGGFGDAGPRRDERGGPDDMEYEWRDSDENDGPAYNWIDITDREDAVNIEGLTDDTLCGYFDLGFEIEYYGNTYDRLAVYPNGYVVLVDDNYQDLIDYFWGWEALPNGNGAPPPPPNVMLIANQDLNPVWTGEIWFWSDERMAVASYIDVAHYNDAQGNQGLWSFQVILNANGFIKFQYRDIGMYADVAGVSIMVGFQNADRDLGFTITRNDQDYLQEELAIGIGQRGSWISWVTFEPEAGDIEADGSVDIEATFLPEGLEDGLYAAEMVITLSDEAQESLVLPLLMSVGEVPVGDVAGTITNARNDQPVEGASVQITPYGFMRTSNGDGEYGAQNLPADNYILTCTAPDYLPALIEELAVEGGQTANGSFALLHSTCEPNPRMIDEILGLNESRDIGITVTNGGNGPLTYTIERRLPGGADAEPWEHRLSFPAEEAVEDPQLTGVAFADGYFYVPGYGDGNLIHVLDRDGNAVRDFPQVGTARNGMGDLTWDGENLWGSGENRIFAFSTEGDSITSFRGAQRNTRGIAWDPDRELLWTCDITSAISALNREGEEQGDLELRNPGFSISGLAYWSEDPDEYQLYISHTDDDNVERLHKMRIDGGDTLFVAELRPENGSPSGAFITSTYDVYSYVYMALSNVSSEEGGDRIDIWQVQGNTGWMLIDPTEGTIDADASQDFTLTLNSAGMPEEEYFGDLVYHHDGVGAETVVNIRMEVTAGPRPPRHFGLLEPADADSLISSEVNFVWQQAVDPDPEDVVNYRLWLMAGEDSLQYQAMDTTMMLSLDTLDLDIQPQGAVTWWVVAESSQDETECDRRFTFYAPPSGVDAGDLTPAAFGLQGIYPNPFNSRARVSFSVPSVGQAFLSVYDLSGRQVWNLPLGGLSAGVHQVALDAGRLPSGVYVLQLESAGKTARMKFALIR